MPITPKWGSFLHAGSHAGASAEESQADGAPKAKASQGDLFAAEGTKEDATSLEALKEYVTEMVPPELRALGKQIYAGIVDDLASAAEALQEKHAALQQAQEFGRKSAANARMLVKLGQLSPEQLVAMHAMEEAAQRREEAIERRHKERMDAAERLNRSRKVIRDEKGRIVSWAIDPGEQAGNA
jgi:DNA repair ATPase RecN